MKIRAISLCLLLAASLARVSWAEAEIEPKRMTIEAVTPLVREFAFRETPGLNRSARFKVEEYDVPDLWKTLKVQVYIVRYLAEDDTEFQVRCVLLHNRKVAEFAGALGGYGVMSGVMLNNKFYYTYSFGSGLHRSYVGRLSVVEGKVKTIESRPFFENDMFVKKAGERIRVESATYREFNSWKEAKQIGFVYSDDKSLRIIDSTGIEVPEAENR